MWASYGCSLRPSTAPDTIASAALATSAGRSLRTASSVKAAAALIGVHPHALPATRCR